jgi:hypothetical protein
MEKAEIYPFLGKIKRSQVSKNSSDFQTIDHSRVIPERPRY